MNKYRLLLNENKFKFLSMREIKHLPTISYKVCLLLLWYFGMGWGGGNFNIRLFFLKKGLIKKRLKIFPTAKFSVCFLYNIKYMKVPFFSLTHSLINVKSYYEQQLRIKLGKLSILNNKLRCSK